MKVPFALLVLSLSLAGCASTATPTLPTSSVEATHLPTRELVAKEGNDMGCDQVLTGESPFPFKVEPGYDQIEVAFHPSGVGNVGLSILDANAHEVGGVPDADPESQPCNHDHTAGVLTYDAQPGNYTAVVRNTGLVDWHLSVNEKVHDAAASEHHHGG